MRDIVIMILCGGARYPADIGSARTVVERRPATTEPTGEVHGWLHRPATTFQSNTENSLLRQQAFHY